MGLFNIFSSSKDEDKIKAFENLRDDTEFVENSTVGGGMRMDNLIVTQGDIITMPVLTDDNRIQNSFHNAKPQYLNQLYKKVPIHSRIVKNTVRELCKNYVFEYPKNVQNDIKLNRFLNNTIEKDDDFDSFNDWLENVLTDFLVNGNIFIKETRNNGSATNFKHLQSERVRVKGEKQTLKKTGYAYNYDWINSGSHIPLDKYNDNLSEGSHVMMLANRLPDFKFYGEPDYISCKEWLELSANISDFYKQHITNGVYPSVLITFYEYPSAPERLENFKKMLKKMGGKTSRGKILTLFGKSPELAPKVESIDANQMDEVFRAVQEDIGREICYAWGVDPATIGMRTAGSLGNSKEIEYQSEDYKERLYNYKKKTTTLVQTMLNNAGCDFVKFKYTD